MQDPRIIQGGMGIGISSWELARTVSRLGQMGVVSGTGLDAVFVRRLANGDPGGHLRRALGAFPAPGIAREALDRYFRPEGRAAGEPYPSLALMQRNLDAWRQRLIVLANFAEVFLAREGHPGRIGINFLTKIQIPTLPSLYGAMLAGVHDVLMGAGIPRDIPGAMDALVGHRPATIRLEVQGGSGADDETLTFDPATIWAGAPAPPLERPRFLAIVSSDSLATIMARKATGRVDGFIVEGPTAGGHNAPPRGRDAVDEHGEPLYGKRDIADVARIATLGLPFWIAGGAGSPEGLRAALAAKASGIQVGTLFAFAEESGLRADLKQRVLALAREGRVQVRTDGRASPTGFPFKTLALEGSLSQEETYAARERICDLGYLRAPYREEGGGIGYRCSAAPVEGYLLKGGAVEDTEGRKCLCNALMANIGLGQVRDGSEEPPLLTSGDDVLRLGAFLAGRETYSAADVIEYLLADVPGPVGSA